MTTTPEEGADPSPTQPDPAEPEPTQPDPPGGDGQSGEGNEIVPRPPRAPTPAAEARKGIKQPREVDGGSDVGSDPGARSLSGFLTFYPFFRFFCAVAHRQFPASHNPETRVARLRQAHPKFYGLCIAMDLVVVSLVTVILVVAGAYAVYKTLR